MAYQRPVLLIALDSRFWLAVWKKPVSTINAFEWVALENHDFLDDGYADIGLQMIKI